MSNLEIQRIESLERRVAELLDLRDSGIVSYPDRVIRAVREITGIQNILATRTLRRVRARALVAWLLRDNGYSYPEIGEVINRDNSTVRHLLKSHPPEPALVRLTKLRLGK